MSAPYLPLAIANYFLAEHSSKTVLEHMKLQKLVYCAHGWWLAAHPAEHPPLVSERPQVWRHGPVFESLYRTLKVFGRGSIKEPQSDSPFIDPPMIDDGETEERTMLRWVWARYGHLSGFALSDLTHKPGTPWSRVAKEHDYVVPYNYEIPDDYIRQEFRGLMIRYGDRNENDRRPPAGERAQA